MHSGITEQCLREIHPGACRRGQERGDTFEICARCGGVCKISPRQVRVQRQAFCAEERELTRGEHTRLCRAAAHGGHTVNAF